MMGKALFCARNETVLKKTPFQLQALESFYSVEKYPKKAQIVECATKLNLTYNQVLWWYKERRKKERQKFNGHSLPVVRCIRQDYNGNNCSFSGRLSSNVCKSGSTKKPHVFRLQKLYQKDYILTKIFRKDGPPLGLEFDPPPRNAFSGRNCARISTPNNGRVFKKRKLMSSYASQISESSRIFEDPNSNDVPARKHGMGKRLMTVWNVSDIHNINISRALPSTNELDSWKLSTSNSDSDSDGSFEENAEHNSVTASHIDVMGRKRTVACSLSSDDVDVLDQSHVMQTLVDDEELELTELQVGPNPLKCSAHLSGSHGCPLCKDLLGRFPPPGVAMKQPFSIRPWDSSPELVRKLFKILGFLYDQFGNLCVRPFTLDEFAQAFHEKDSLLLGELHVNLLKWLLKEAEVGTADGFVPRSSQDCAFLKFMNFVCEQEFDVHVWNISLNSLSWAEILRHVLIAAGFGSKKNKLQHSDKEITEMVKYGLHPRTLKGELFALLSNRGAVGIKVSELAKLPQIADLILTNISGSLEEMIHSTLSSDITLFEKISSDAFRLRVDPRVKGKDDHHSDTDDSGSVDNDICLDTAAPCNSLGSFYLEKRAPSGLESTVMENAIVEKGDHPNVNNCIEIDESYSGEAWVLGLMEGEYSDLSIQEKLDMLQALVNLVGSAKSNLRIEETLPNTPAVQLHRSGGKIKKKLRESNPLSDEAAGRQNVANAMTCGGKSALLRRPGQQDRSYYDNTCESEEQHRWNHSLQSVFLGSDRRYNNYWLFLGPCTDEDPGHRRVYFESSEDGHWEVVDTPQALHSLLCTLDSRGIREFRLLSSLKKRQEFLFDAMKKFVEKENRARCCPNSSHSESSGDRSSPVSDIDNTANLSESTGCDASGAIGFEELRYSDEKILRWQKSQEYDKWVWNSFYLVLNAVKNSRKSFADSLRRCECCHDLYWRDEKHCRICHSTFEVDFDLEERYAVHVATCREAGSKTSYPKHKVLPTHLQTLKAAFHAIEAALPDAALANSWKKSVHKLWIKRLRRTSSLSELFQVLVDFVGAINEEWLYECSPSIDVRSHVDNITIYFQTMPQTCSSLALWLVKLDALIALRLKEG